MQDSSKRRAIFQAISMSEIYISTILLVLSISSTGYFVRKAYTRTNTKKVISAFQLKYRKKTYRRF